MSASGITFGGLASGLDTQAIITALLAVERRPIQALESKKQGLQDQARLFGDLRSNLESLRDAANDIRQSINLLEFKASVDREDFLTASAGSGAIAGSLASAASSIWENVKSRGNAARLTHFSARPADSTVPVAA